MSQIVSSLLFYKNDFGIDIKLNNETKQNNFFSSYNVWKHVRYHVLISRQPGVITQFR